MCLGLFVCQNRGIDYIIISLLFSLLPKKWPQMIEARGGITHIKTNNSLYGMISFKDDQDIRVSWSLAA